MILKLGSPILAGLLVMIPCAVVAAQTRNDVLHTQGIREQIARMGTGRQATAEVTLLTD
ncbi:MAG: hypothetical protein ABR555_03725 [Pyrinomonadaceae bacterium]